MEQSGSFFSFLLDNLNQFLSFTGFANLTVGHGIMIVVGL
ncbi:MAG: sodium ion-translocating decarboxylase subunit beta, partial [Tenuifilum sp.]